MISLRRARPDDEALAIRLHIEEPLSRYLFTVPRLDFTQAREWFAGMLEASDPPGEYILAAEEDGKVVGFAWFMNYDGQNAYISIAMMRHRGKGLSVEITRQALDYGFNQLGLHRVSTTVVDGNEQAAKLANRYSTIEGRIREGFKCGDGSVRDVILYGLLASEWQEA